MEAINFLLTIRDLLERRGQSPFEDMLNGFLAAKMTIVFQDTSFLALQDIKNLIDKLLTESPDNTLDLMMQLDRATPFFSLIFSSVHNCRACMLQDYVLASHRDILERLCKNLKVAIESSNQSLVVQTLHRIVLMSQNSERVKKAIESIFDFRKIVRDLELRRFDVEAQLFVLQCLLEMQADKIIYVDSIMSFEAILLH